MVTLYGHILNDLNVIKFDKKGVRFIFLILRILLCGDVSSTNMSRVFFLNVFSMLHNSLFAAEEN